MVPLKPEAKSTVAVAALAPNDAEPLTPEEDEFYNQVLEARREKKKAELSEYKRRARFDPLASKQAAQQQQQNPVVPAAAIEPSGSPPSGVARHPPRRPMEQLQQPPSQRQQQSTSDVPTTAQSRGPATSSSSMRAVPAASGDDDSDDDDIDDAAFEAAALRFLQDEPEEVVAETSQDPAQVPRQQKSQPSTTIQPGSAMRRRTVMVPGAFKPGALSSRSSSLQLGPTTPTAARPAGSMPTAASTRAPQQQQQQKAAGSGRAGTGAASRGSDEAAAVAAALKGEFGLSDEAIAAALADDGDGDSAEGGEAEELDWDTLVAGESFEKYLEELQEEEDKAKVRRQRAEARQKSAAAAKPAATTKQESLQEVPAEDAELESLLKFLEMVEKGEETGSKGNAGSTTGSSKAGAKGSKEAKEDMEDDIDWGLLEKMFLGPNWDKEVQEMAKLAAGDSSDVGAAGQGAEPGSEEAPSWADEVTTLLLGLVGISHQRYLNKPLLDREVPEEERAQAFWEAPFALLVQDDSRQAMLEYANQKALELLGYQFDDIYDLSSFDTVEASDVQQQEWLWATSEVEEKMGKHTMVPELKLRDCRGKCIVARNVLLFRVDNLEGESMGQAIVIREWAPQ